MDFLPVCWRSDRLFALIIFRDGKSVDPSDYGRPEMKQRVAEMIIQFLSDVSCDRIRQI